MNFNATHVLRIEREQVSVVSHEDVSLDSAVSSLWDLENLGILDKLSSIKAKFSLIVAHFRHEIFYWLVQKIRSLSPQIPAIIQFHDQK